MKKNQLVGNRLVCVFSFLTLASCTTTHRLASTSPNDMMASIKVYDVVQIYGKTNTLLEFTVTEVSETGIRGDGVFVPYADIQKISVIRQSRIRTILLVGLGIVALYALEKNADCGIFDWSEECED